MEYRREIDGLRALAVIPIILFHAGFDTFSGGFVGVDVFFVISGYLITSIILSEREAGTFSLVDFYERRARRILPALFFVMLTCIPFAWFWLSPSDMKGFSESLIAVPVAVSNFLFWQRSGYFDTAAELKPLLHTWSLAVEEQYYLLFPTFLVLTWRLRRHWVIGILIVVALISLALAQWGALHHPQATFFLLPTRIWELLIGVFVAFHLFGKEDTKIKSGYSSNLTQLLSISGLFSIIYSIFVFDRQTLFPSLYTLIPTLGTAFIVLFATQQTIVGKILSSKVLVGLGLISYSAYLWHQPLFAFARPRALADPAEDVFILLIPLAIAAAYLSWRFVERPFRNKSVVSRKSLFISTIFFTVFFVLLGLAGVLTRGFVDMKANYMQKQILATVDRSPKRKECHTSGADYRKPENACQYYVPDGSWAVLGDSHAVELAYALAKVLKKDNKGVKHFSFSGCAPAYGRIDKTHSDSINCSHWTEEVAAHIIADRSISTVVVSYHTAGWAASNSNENVADPWHSYKGILHAFKAAGKDVVLVLQAPSLDERIEDLIFRLDSPPLNIPGRKRKEWEELQKYITERKNEISDEVTIINPSDLFCDENNCYVARDGVALYFDNHHMSVAGALLVAEEVIERVTDKSER
jgi:peptidoglycan/LPS O-acetylase OafA/YrhL